MFPGEISFLPEQSQHDAEIELINEEAFGPGRFTRAASKIREAGGHDPKLSFVAVKGDLIVGSVRMTPIAAGQGRGYMLGPLAVRPTHKNAGIGRTLVAVALDAARQAGVDLVFLVGDPPYYEPLGFKKLRRNQVELPRPVDQDRVLVAELVEGTAAQLVGKLDHACKQDGWLSEEPAAKLRVAAG